MEEGYVVIQVLSRGLQAVVKGVTVFSTKAAADTETRYTQSEDMFIVKVPAKILKGAKEL